jgi:hypothetical protein
MDVPLQYRRAGPVGAVKVPAGGYRWATGEQMKVFLVSVLALVSVGTVATALAFGHSTVTAGMAAVASQAAAGTTSEPAAMLLSGSALLGLAGAVKRFTF